MNSTQIERILSKYPVSAPYYRVCLPVDLLWESRKHFVALNYNIVVVNTATSREDFGHWLLLFFAPRSTSSWICYFIDSYGRNIQDFDARILKFVNYFTHEIQNNPTKLQQNSSCMCGLYVIFFAIFLSASYSLAAILSWFSKRDLQLNDISVLHYLKNCVKIPKMERDLLTCKIQNNQRCKSCAGKEWMPVLDRLL